MKLNCSLRSHVAFEIDRYRERGKEREEREREIQ